MSEAETMVFVIDDEPSVRDAILNLMRSAGLVLRRPLHALVAAQRRLAEAR